MGGLACRVSCQAAEAADSLRREEESMQFECPRHNNLTPFHLQFAEGTARP